MGSCREDFDQGLPERQPEPGGFERFAFLFQVQNLLFLRQTLVAMIEIPNQPWGPRTLAKSVSLAGSQVCTEVSGRVARTLRLQSGYSLGDAGTGQG